MMEFQLRNFQTLTEGTKVTLTYELNRYTLKVLQCKPAKGRIILRNLSLSLSLRISHNTVVRNILKMKIWVLWLRIVVSFTNSLSFFMKVVFKYNVVVFIFLICTHTGISILNADITTDITEPADLSRFVGCLGSCDLTWLSCDSQLSLFDPHSTL